MSAVDYVGSIGPDGIAGTPRYMAPEQVRGEEADPRSDIFSFGCVLYEMVSARPAFAGGTTEEVMSTILHSDPSNLPIDQSGADTANASKNKVTFTPLIPVTGNYKVYSYFVKTPKTSNKTKLAVHDGKTSQNIVINKSEIAIEGQTSGEWVYLGNFLLPKGKQSSVTITDKDADGALVADAILLVHMK